MTDVCLPKEYTFLHKKVMALWVWLYPIVLCGILYLITWKCSRWVPKPHRDQGPLFERKTLILIGIYIRERDVYMLT